MIYVGVDIAKQLHRVAAVNDQAEVVLPPFKVPETQEAFDHLDKKLRGLGQPDLRIGMEATGHYWLLLHAFLVQKGWTVEVFNPVLSAPPPGARLRGRKSDSDDAIGIAMTIRDGGFTPFTPPSEDVDALKTLCRQRQYHANELRNAKKRFGGLVDRVFPEFRSFFSDPYGKSALAILQAFPSACALAEAHLRTLKATIRRIAGARANDQLAERIREAARKSPARLLSDPGREEAISLFIEHLQDLQEKIARVESRIRDRYQVIESQLKSITGIGAIVGPVILSELGDLDRFRGNKPAKKILAMAGLDPRVRDSGKFKGHRRMSKRGSRSLRTALFQAASMARLHSPGFGAIYERQKAKGKHHYVAVSHVARKMVEVIWAVHKSDRPFSEDLLAT